MSLGGEARYTLRGIRCKLSVLPHLKISRKARGGAKGTWRTLRGCTTATWRRHGSLEFSEGTLAAHALRICVAKWLRAWRTRVRLTLVHHFE